MRYAWRMIAVAAISGVASWPTLAADLPTLQAGQDLRQLRAEVAAAEAVRSVKRLQHSMAHYLEWGLWPELGDLFTARASGDFDGQVVTGSEGLGRYFMQQAEREAGGIERGQLNTHLIMQPIVTLGPDGRSARATWHEFALLGRFGKQARWQGGVYENEYRHEHGRWLISRIRFVKQYAGDYDAWGHAAPARWNIGYHFDAQHVGVTIPAAALQALVASTPQGQRIDGLARLAGRVQQLEDETLVQNLQHSLGYYLDRKHWNDVVDLFTPNGSMQVGLERPAPGAVAIQHALESRFGPAGLREGELFDHILLATVVTVAADGRSASARSLSLGMLGRNGESAAWETGIFENSYVRVDGIWKLDQLRYFPRMRTNYDLGWARDAQAVAAGSYGSYPAAYFVGMHFPHPVTGRTAKWRGAQRVNVPPVRPAAGSSAYVAAATAKADVAAVLQRARAAIAVDAVENLNSSYGYYIDESAWDEMADTFGATGSKEITGAGVYVGTERIRAILKRRGPLGGRTPSFFTIHQLTQPVIHVAADGKSARARLRLFQCGGSADGSTGSWIGGIYENTANFENGEWKFGAQDLHHLFNASYRNGWARLGAAAQAARPAAGREVAGGGIQQGLGGAARPAAFVAEMPPDRPIRARQYAFPQISEPAFHYLNPVTGRAPAALLQ